VLHPLILAIAAVDLCALALVLAAAVTAMRVVIGWSPGSAERAQLALERRSETASLLGRLAWGLTVAAGLLLVAGMAGVLPDLVPGAMCGTGVVRASDGAATRALITRSLAVASLASWHLLDRLDRSSPLAPLRPASARALLLSTPLLVLAVRDTAALFGSLDPYQAVACCSVVYDAVGLDGAGISLAERSWLLPAAGLGALALAAVGALLRWGPTGALRVGSSLAGLLAVVWLPLAVTALISELTPYHYQVLQHHCPWCLFLGEHSMLGYPLFGALAVIALEGPGATLASRVGERVPEVTGEAARRVRSAGLRLLIATVVFALLAGGPALLWRLRHGVWMG
jgi:hypothetical protein